MSLYSQLERQLEKSKTHGKGNKNYKTIPCTRYASGWCEYNDDCWFIHDRDESYASRHSPTTTITAPSLSAHRTPFDMSGLVSSIPRLSIPMSPPRVNMTKKEQSCFAYQRNSCMKGDACPYRHESSPRSPLSPARSSPDRYRATTKQPCFDLMRTGTCPKGEACIFHESIERYAQWFKNVDCKLYPQGKCKHAETCLFRHANPTLNIDHVTVEPPLYRYQPRPSLEDPFQNEGRRCPFSTETILCSNRDMCHVHGIPSRVPSSFRGLHQRNQTSSASSVGSSSSAAYESPSSPISSGYATSRMSHTSSSESKFSNSDDPLNIMRCIDDSEDDEYIVYEAPLLRT